jgi:hypothetical protein
MWGIAMPRQYGFQRQCLLGDARLQLVPRWTALEDLAVYSQPGSWGIH